MLKFPMSLKFCSLACLVIACTPLVPGTCSECALLLEITRADSEEGLQHPLSAKCSSVFRALIDQILTCQTGSFPSLALQGMQTLWICLMSKKKISQNLSLILFQMEISSLYESALRRVNCHLFCNHFLSIDN